MDGVLAYVTLFAGNFAPRGWAFCQGQILPIAQNTALFSLLGTTYGGNGQTTFALPDLRGRSVVGVGQGPGLSSYSLGQVGGVETTTLLINQMPAHAHNVLVNLTPPCASSAGTTSNPNDAVYAPDAGSNQAYSSSHNNNMKPFPVALVTAIVGSSTPFSNRNPYLGLNYVICMQGIFPSRN